MNITIKGTPTELVITTVSIVPEADSKILYKFLCVHCSGFVAQYQGQIVKIYPILEPNDQAVVITPCKLCNSKYTFQTHAAYDTGTTKVMLEKLDRPELNYFFCFRHRGRALVDYAGRSIHTRNHIVTVPFSTSCPQCEQSFWFTDLV